MNWDVDLPPDWTPDPGSGVHGCGCPEHGVGGLFGPRPGPLTMGVRERGRGPDREGGWRWTGGGIRKVGDGSKRSRNRGGRTRTGTARRGHWPGAGSEAGEGAGAQGWVQKAHERGSDAGDARGQRARRRVFSSRQRDGERRRRPTRNGAIRSTSLHGLSWRTSGHARQWLGQPWVSPTGMTALWGRLPGAPPTAVCSRHHPAQHRGRL